jgi:rfaE bifunctional protein kinase chain/domain
MNTQRLESLLARFPTLTLLVIGDYFLDRYFHIDRALAEVSLETGLEAHQVAQVRSDPGAAGTVTSNLRALGVSVIALGVIGDDGEGYELKRALAARGVDISPLIESRDRFTPTYTKPQLREADGVTRELNRMDIKNRVPLSAELEAAILTRLHNLAPRVDGVIVVDQVQEPNCGVITDRVRDEIAALARERPQQIFVAESRERIGLFREVIVEANAREARRAVGLGDDAAVEALGAALYRCNCKPVIITVGAEGILVFDAAGSARVPGMRAQGPIDTVGAGDSVVAGLTAALGAGASLREAAAVGNLVASVTIQQIGTTGTATRVQVLEAQRAFERSAEAAQVLTPHKARGIIELEGSQ